MSCLLPPFKCPPGLDNSTFSFHSRPLLHHHHHHHAKDLFFRAQCALSTTTSPSAAVLELEKLRLSSLEPHLNSVAANKTWTYTGAVGPPKEETFQATVATETLITSDEAVISAAAAEAVALARAAVKVAKDAAALINSQYSMKAESKTANTYTFSSIRSQLTEAERADILGVDANGEASQSTEDTSIKEESECLEPTLAELSVLEEELSEDIAVRSTKQNERKGRRARAAEKVSSAANVSTKSIPTNRRKRGSIQEVDHSDPLRYLRSTTSTSRLLTSAEELEFSEGIQDLLKIERLHKELVERYGGEPTFVQWAAAAGVDQKTLRRRLNHGTICKDKMIKSNIRLVISIAKNYQGSGMNLQDLVQEGCRGLVRGAEKFDASKGFKFSTYAHWWIKQAVRKSLSDQSRTIRLPFHMVEASYKVKEARRVLYSENGRQPNNEEVAEAAGLSMKRLEAVLLTPKAPRSLDQKMGVNMDLKPSEVIADPDAETSEDLLMKQFMKQDLDKVLDTLNPRESQVIRWRFGLDDGRMKTLQEIGELIGVSRERIRQIESSAFLKLKNKKRTKQLEQYVVS
ncbi:unnamed protein product [Linum tenue]|uniref:RNA polymerase sigma factor n=1 Tax=Linum tenue TaxID=586396 RepID=A0AAV0HIW6_9ROSI|nr:unnamed protein product [Linum tenue]